MTAFSPVYAGDDWRYESTLLDSDGAAITALDNAWFSMYTSKTDETLSYTLADAEVTLASNVLTIVPPAADTTAVADGSYYIDIKIAPTGGDVQLVEKKARQRVINDHPLYDNYA